MTTAHRRQRDPAFPHGVSPHGASPGRRAGFSRRRFLAAGAAGLGAAVCVPRFVKAGRAAEQAADAADLPRVDLHVHLDNSTIDEVLKLSEERGVTFGIVEHAGTRENKYPVVLSNDRELERYLAMLDGKPVYRGVQAEWTDWSDCFSPEVRGRLDYVLMDAMTYPGKDGSRVKLWEPGVESRVEMSDREAFMDRFVDFHVALVEKQPITILGNVSWLPGPLAADYEKFWTAARVRRVAEAAARRGVALEISSGFKLPKLGFLEVAKATGAKFCFGTNGRYPNMGKLDYSLAMARQLKLTPADIYVPKRKARGAAG